MPTLAAWVFAGAESGRRARPTISTAVTHAGGTVLDAALIEWHPDATAPVCARGVDVGAARKERGGFLGQVVAALIGSRSMPGVGYGFAGYAVADALQDSGFDDVTIERVESALRVDTSAVLMVVDVADALTDVAPADVMVRALQTIPIEDAAEALAGFRR